MKHIYNIYNILYKKNILIHKYLYMNIQLLLLLLLSIIVHLFNYIF